VRRHFQVPAAPHAEKIAKPRRQKSIAANEL
jgi:hypothetical protein